MERYTGGALRLCSHEAPEFVSERAWDVPARKGLLVAVRADTRPYTTVGRLQAPKG